MSSNLTLGIMRELLYEGLKLSLWTGYNGANEVKMKTYELFSGQELQIAEKIQQRRYQMLVHSCLYYHLNQNIISDKQWDAWARELRDLQNQYPEISKQVTLYEYFRDWDASTGAFLPITESWVVMRAKQVAGINEKKVIVKQSVKPTKTKAKKRLF